MTKWLPWMKYVVSTVLVVMVIALPALSRAADGDHQTLKEWFQMMDARYPVGENAEASAIGGESDEEKGTGFEPYQRFKYFMQRRLGDQDDFVPGGRWEAWKQLRSMEEQQGTSSPTWFSLGPINVSGRCLCIEIHPTNTNIAYAGFADGGIWKTTDAGVTWTPIGDELPTLAISCIEIDVNNPNRIWMGTGEGWGNIDAVHGVGVLMSTDAGATWTTTGYSYPLSQGRDTYELEYNPVTGTLMLAAANGVWRSTDGGATFTQTATFGSWRDIELQHGSSTNMFGVCTSGSNNGFYRSFDDGLTWTQTTTGAPASSIVGNSRFGLTAADPNLIYWSVSNSGGTGQGVWKSTDGGATFFQVTTASLLGNQGWYDLSIDVDPNNGNTVFAGGVDFYRSTNGGATFSQWGSSIHVDHHATAWSLSDPTHFWIGSDGGVWRSTNSGSTFTSCNNGLTTLQFYAINHSVTLPTRALGGTQDNGTYQYDNSLVWSHEIGGDGFFCEVDRTDANVEYGELYYGDHRRTLNGGASWQSINNGITPSSGPWSTPTWMDYSDPNTLYAGHNTRIYKTTNRGTNWAALPTPSYTQGGVNFSQSLRHPDTIGFVTGSRVFVSNDHGATWLSRGGGTSLSDIAVHPDDINIILTTHSTFLSGVATVRKSVDNGATWTDISGSLPDEPANSIEIDPSNPNTYYLGTDLGVYATFDGGLNWTPFNTGLPHALVADLRIHDSARLIRVGTHGRGMWECDISGVTATSVAAGQHIDVQPITLRVLGNPSASQVGLRYGIRQPGRVHLALYDANGRKVRDLFDEFQYAIMGSVDVDLRDLPAGMYFARLEANGATLSEKVLVQR